MDGLKPTHPPGTSTFRAKATASMRGGMRRSPRLPVDLEGALTGRVVHPVRLVDLSLTGCLVRCDALLEPGAILDLRLQLADETLTAKVRVVDSSLDGSVAAEASSGAMAGLDFVSLAAQDQTRLRRFLEEERRRRRSADAPSD
jgi:hypothetical protein